MSLLERNAAGFHYRVTYWPVNLTSESSWSVSSAGVQRLYDWTSSELVIEDQRTFQPFVVFVQAVNDEGEAPTSFLEKRIGYTGQDGTSIQLDGARVIRGHFEGNTVPIVEKLSERTFPLLNCSKTHYGRHCEPFPGQK